MRFRLFGPLGAESPSGPVDLGPPKQRAVLAILLLHANEVVATERLIDQVWGEQPPKTADHSVQIYISDLRKVLSDVVIETRPPGYVLKAEANNLDILVFERLAAEGLASSRSGTPDVGLSLLEQALEIWSGEPLQEFEYQEFARQRIRILSETRADVIEALAAWYLDQDDLGRVRGYCRGLIDEQPFREEPRRLMMLALYRSGRQADALREYGGFQRVLAEELGTEPSEGLKSLEERILLHDPELVGGRPQPVDEVNPYRGLRSFAEEDSKIYFGRETLVEEVSGRLGKGEKLVSVVGPSGCGKSSALRAGVTPKLWEAGLTVGYLRPGPRPLWELAGALQQLGLGSRQALFRRLESEEGSLASLVDRPLVLIIDQFEELFTLADSEVAGRFVDEVAAAVVSPDCGLALVLALRADYFDRPLSMPALAGLFAASIISVGPMTALGLERAIVEPARASGRDVEPGLLAQLIADMRDQPGALPLLQFTLFDLYERSTGGLTLAMYEDMGGLHGALTAAADEIVEGLSPSERELAEQLFMRLVKRTRLGFAAAPASLRSILELGDRLDLRRVLESFGERRLLTFSRDEDDGAIVQVAHEYLIGGWPRLESWIDAHSFDLEMLSALRSAVAEWEANERSEDFLFRGDRLGRTVQWRDSTSMRLTSAEKAFIDVAIAVRDRPPPPPDVVVWFHRRGDGSFGDLIGAGIDRAMETLGVDVLEHTGQFSHLGAVEDAVLAGSRLVFVDSLEATNPLLSGFIAFHSETLFMLMGAAPVGDDLALLPNVRRLVAASEEMGYLAGIAAGLATGKGAVGFIGGLDLPMVREFHAGYEEGVERTRPGCRVESIYLTRATEPVDMSGFDSVALGEAAAALLHRAGVDIIFHAAGGSGWGMFNWAANHLRETGERVEAIGVDIDQAGQLEVLKDEWGVDPSDFKVMRELILTSVVWRLDLEIPEVIRTFLETGDAESIRARVRNGFIGYAGLDAFDEEQRALLGSAVDDLRRGEVIIPTTPRGAVRRLLEVLGG